MWFSGLRPKGNQLHCSLSFTQKLSKNMLFDPPDWLLHLPCFVNYCAIYIYSLPHIIYSKQFNHYQQISSQRKCECFFISAYCEFLVLTNKSKYYHENCREILICTMKCVYWQYCFIHFTLLFCMSLYNPLLLYPLTILLFTAQDHFVHCHIVVTQNCAKCLK